MLKRRMNMTKTTALIILKEYQDWRRGRNAYDWRKSTSPEGMKRFPYSSLQIGVAIDVAIDALEMSISKKKG
jgi:hypothetical protein